MRKFGLAAAGFFALATVFAGVLVPAAQADTVACTAYLTEEGKDTTARVQICAETETAGDTVSQEYAKLVCLPLMSLTGLSKEHTIEACTLAVEP